MDAFLEELDDVICKQIGSRTKTCIVGDFNAKNQIGTVDNKPTKQD